MAQINKPDTYFNTVLWTGDNTDKTISGVGFQPDWVWWKQRNGTDDHRLLDSVRGEGSASYKLLFSSGSYAEFDGNDNGGSQGNINAITSDGFSGVQGTTGWNNWNGSGLNYVGWNWLGANGTASNTDGSITSTVSANTTSGFSIVSYTGTGSNATVGHGLGSAPAFIIFKDRSTTKDWFVYHQSISPATGGKLNLTVNPGADSGYFQNTAPTSSVFSIGNANTVNPSSNEMIAYCFAEKKGYSKFGSYVGNGSTDGTFVYTGFKPAYLMVKRTDSTSNWNIFDNKRNPYNNPGILIAANNANADASSYPIDFISNGFKARSTLSDFNASGGTFIYMAFAENPLVGTNNIPATAR